MKLLLVCAGGLSSSRISESIAKAGTEMNIELMLSSCSICDIQNNIKDVDVILLGPQVRYQAEKIREISNGTPVMVIDKLDYGLQDGNKIILSVLSSFKREENIEAMEGR